MRRARMSHKSAMTARRSVFILAAAFIAVGFLPQLAPAPGRSSLAPGHRGAPEAPGWAHRHRQDWAIKRRPAAQGDRSVEHP